VYKEIWRGLSLFCKEKQGEREAKRGQNPPINQEREEGGIYTTLYHPGYTTMVYIPPLYTSLGTPLGIPPYPALPGTPTPVFSCPDDEALGSVLGIIRGERLSAPLNLPKVLKVVYPSAQSCAGLPAHKLTTIG